MMKTMMRHCRDLLARLRCDESGVGAVEFGLLVPILLTLYMGSIELSTLISVDKRVSTVAGSIGDLVARTDGALPQAVLNDYFAASSATMAPYGSGGLAQIVTSVYIDADGDATVQWSRGFNGGTPHLVAASYDLPSELTNLSRDSYVIVAEAAISYQPMLGYVFPSAFDLYREYYFLPRFGSAITVT